MTGHKHSTKHDCKLHCQPLIVRWNDNPPSLFNGLLVSRIASACNNVVYLLKYWTINVHLPLYKFFINHLSIFLNMLFSWQFVVVFHVNQLDIINRTSLHDWTQTFHRTWLQVAFSTSHCTLEWQPAFTVQWSVCVQDCKRLKQCSSHLTMNNHCVSIRKFFMLIITLCK